MASRYLMPLRRGSLTANPPAGPLSGLGGGSLWDLHRQVNRLFDDLFDRGEPGPVAGGGFAAPAMDVHQDDRQIEITAELPGVKEEDIDLSIEDGVLTLSGEKRSERQDENGYSERSYGRFERRLTLPSNVDEENCAADFRDGVLRITIPRAEEKSRGRRIPLGGSRRTGAIEAQNDAEAGPQQQVAGEDRGDDRTDEQQS